MSTFELLMSVVYLLSSLLLFGIGIFMYKVQKRKINVLHELKVQRNTALAIAFSGYCVGLLLAIGSAHFGEHVSLISDVTSIAVYGLGAIVLLSVSSVINDKIIFRKFEIHKEIIIDQNNGTGVIEAVNYASTGLIIYGASSGGVDHLTILVYWLMAQVILVITSLIYDRLIADDIHDEIEKDNVSVALGFSGLILSIAIILSYAVSLHDQTVIGSVKHIGAITAIGLILLPISRYIVRKILKLGKKSEGDMEPVSTGLIEGVAYVMVAILITWCF